MSPSKKIDRLPKMRDNKTPAPRNKPSSILRSRGVDEKHSARKLKIPVYKKEMGVSHSTSILKNLPFVKSPLQCIKEDTSKRFNEQETFINSLIINGDKLKKEKLIEKI
jgi:hypothetical protein